MLGSRTTESQRGQVSPCLIALSVIPRIPCVKYLPGGSRPASPGITGLVADVEDPRPARVQCVGAVITDPTGRLLLILRGHEPGMGLWSIPGGRIEPGETDQDAVVREVMEETGLAVTCGPLLG